MHGQPQTPLLAAYFDRLKDLKRFFVARTGSEIEAEDLMQDLYLKVAGLSADAEVRNPAAFLYRLSSNLMLDRLRRQRRSSVRDGAYRLATTETAGSEDVADLPTAEMAVAARQSLEQLTRALEALSPRAQEIFRLHKFEGLSQQETADRLGLTRKAVEKQISAALRHLLASRKP